MSEDDFRLDFAREARIGLPEAIFCEGKTAAQIAAILDAGDARGAGLLLTRLSHDKLAALGEERRARLDVCSLSRTAVFGPMPALRNSGRVAIVAAGTSDLPVAREAERTLRYGGEAADVIADVGVAGLWRLAERLEEIRRARVVIAVAGMDAALASVLGGLVGGVVIGVPTSVGYGVAAGGQVALGAMLASCAPGLLVCNIDNGYGAASAALRVLAAIDQPSPAGKD